MPNTVIHIKNGDHPIYLRHRRMLSKNITEAGNLGRGHRPLEVIEFLSTEKHFFFFTIEITFLFCVC
jgi:hypothetical protein